MHISYIEVSGDTAQNVEAFQQMVEFMADNDMGYFSLNHPVDRDPVCGYTGIIPLGGTCPRCGRKENEGVAASKLLSLTSYSPDPEYAIPYDTEDVRDETLTNDIETH